MREFVFPSKFVWESETYKDNYGKFTVEPLERGYGVTIGNCLRRILLSSIPGIAVTALRVEGAKHEFSTIDGIKEDAIEIVLNIKQISLKQVVSEFPHTVRVQIKGKTEVSAEDLFPDGSVEVLNKHLHIATVNPEKTISLELEISRGFGYLPIEKMQQEKKTAPLGTILIDGIFTPIRKVTFHTENTRVGQSVDYEKLTLEVWTTGAIGPKESVETATAIMAKHLALVERGQAAVEAEPKEVVGAQPLPPEADLAVPVTELKLSTRVCNALAARNILTLGQLLQTPRERFEEMKNLGKKSIEEIEEALQKKGYALPTFGESKKRGEKE